MNVLTVSGNLGKDAVVRQTSGTSVAGFSVAMKSGFGDKQQTIWLDCSLWGKQAESGLIQYLTKGQMVVVSGEMGTREYEGKTYITMRVDRVTLAGGRDSGQAGGQAAAQSPAQAPQASQVMDDYSDDIPFS